MVQFLDAIQHLVDCLPQSSFGNGLSGSSMFSQGFLKVTRTILHRHVEFLVLNPAVVVPNYMRTSPLRYRC